MTPSFLGRKRRMYEDYLIETLEKVNRVSTRDLPSEKAVR